MRTEFRFLPGPHYLYGKVHRNLRYRLADFCREKKFTPHIGWFLLIQDPIQRSWSGWPDWANLRPMGYCLLWVGFRKILATFFDCNDRRPNLFWLLKEIIKYIVRIFHRQTRAPFCSVIRGSVFHWQISIKRGLVMQGTYVYLHMYTMNVFKCPVLQ
jgi:hypothetical protein